MKINLSSDETYELKIPQEIDKSQLEGIIIKLRAIAKLGFDELAPQVQTKEKMPRGTGLTAQVLKDKDKAIFFLNELKSKGVKEMMEIYGASKASVYNIKCRALKQWHLTEGVDYAINT